MDLLRAFFLLWETGVIGCLVGMMIGLMMIVLLSKR